MAPSPDRSAAAPPAREVYSVTRVNREVRALLERGLPVLGGGRAHELLATLIRALVLHAQGPGSAAALRHVPDEERARGLHTGRRRSGPGARPHQRVRGAR